MLCAMALRLPSRQKFRTIAPIPNWGNVVFVFFDDTVDHVVDGFCVVAFV